MLNNTQSVLNSLIKNRKYTINRLNGLTNEVSLVKLDPIDDNNVEQNKSFSSVETSINDFENLLELNKNNEYTFILRIYGAASNFIDRDLETKVIKYASKENLCPMIIYTDNKTYRVEEFLNNYIQSDNNSLLKNLLHVFKKLSVFNSIEMLEYSCNNFIKEDIKINTQSISNRFIKLYSEDDNIKLQKNSNYLFSIKTNFVGYFLTLILPKAKEHISYHINKFKNLVKSSDSDVIKQKYNLKLEKTQKAEEFLSNFDFNYKALLPKNGILVLSHNDLHKGNIMINYCNNKLNDIKFLDMEFAKMNLFGIDIVNFLIEFCFDYSDYPRYTFTGYNCKKYYDMYKNFVEIYFNTCSSSFDAYLKNNNLNLNDLINKYSHFDYYRLLVKYSCAFWIVVESYYVNDDDNEFSYLDYMIDRLSIYNEV